MKNKIFNHIVLCGLLNSSVILVGMETTSEQKMPLTPRSTSPQPQTSDKKRHPHHPSHNATSASTSNSPHPQAHHHHHHHTSQSSSSSSLIPKLEKAEEEVHSVGDAVLGAITENPQVVTEVLTPFVGEQPAKIITGAVEQDASLIKTGIDKADDFVKEYEKTHPQQPAQTTLQSSTNQQTEQASSSKQSKITQNPSDNKNSTLMIGGIAISLASILLLLYKYDYVPNIQQFLNKLVSSQATT